MAGVSGKVRPVIELKIAGLNVFKIKIYTKNLIGYFIK